MHYCRLAESHLTGNSYSQREYLHTLREGLHSYTKHFGVIVACGENIDLEKFSLVIHTSPFFKFKPF